MNPEEIITSGILEMYVCGALPADEALEVEQAIESYPEVKREIEIIEESLLHLAKQVAPPVQAMTWTYILNAIRNVNNGEADKVRSLNWPAVTGCRGHIVYGRNYVDVQRNK